MIFFSSFLVLKITTHSLIINQNEKRRSERKSKKAVAQRRLQICLQTLIYTNFYPFCCSCSYKKNGNNEKRSLSVDIVSLGILWRIFPRLFWWKVAVLRWCLLWVMNFWWVDCKNLFWVSKLDELLSKLFLCFQRLLKIWTTEENFSSHQLLKRTFCSFVDIQ